MLALCLLFILIYIYTNKKVKSRLNMINPENPMEIYTGQRFPPPPPISTWSVQPSIWHSSSNF